MVGLIKRERRMVAVPCELPPRLATADLPLSPIFGLGGTYRLPLEVKPHRVRRTQATRCDLSDSRGKRQSFSGSKGRDAFVGIPVLLHGIDVPSLRAGLRRRAQSPAR